MSFTMVGETKTIFAVIPKISSLKYYLGIIDPSEKKDKSAPTDFQWQILKARFFIWKNPELIAAPVQRQTTQIHIIIGDDFEDLLRERAKDQKLNLKGPFKLDEYIYLECINYTLSFRMAPQWQKIKNHFVFSNDFLSSEEPMEAIKLGLSVIDDKLRMTATMQRVRLPLLNLQELGVNLEKLQQTGKAPIYNQTVYILPELKEGTAVDIHVKIPEGCPFTTYSQMRRYWKNIHGYRLPHDEEGMLFVRVSFDCNNTTYSYPVVCTRPGKFHPLKSKYPDLVLSKFGEHMMKKCPTICGKEMNPFVEEQDSSFPLSNLISMKVRTEEPKKKGKSSGEAASAKSVPGYTPQPTISKFPMPLIHLRLPQTIPAKVPEPIQIYKELEHRRSNQNKVVQDSVGVKELKPLVVTDKGESRGAKRKGESPEDSTVLKMRKIMPLSEFIRLERKNHDGLKYPCKLKSCFVALIKIDLKKWQEMNGSGSYKSTNDLNTDKENTSSESEISLNVAKEMEINVSDVTSRDTVENQLNKKSTPKANKEKEGKTRDNTGGKNFILKFPRIFLKSRCPTTSKSELCETTHESDEDPPRKLQRLDVVGIEHMNNDTTVKITRNNKYVIKSELVPPKNSPDSTEELGIKKEIKTDLRDVCIQVEKNTSIENLVQEISVYSTKKSVNVKETETQEDDLEI